VNKSRREIGQVNDYCQGIDDGVDAQLRAHHVVRKSGLVRTDLLQDFPDDFRYVLGLQEMVPVGMADGYAQITGRPALVNLHTAPGLGNGMGALWNAWWSKTPLIVTAGNQRRKMQNQQALLTNIDATLFPRPVVKWAAEPTTAAEVPAVLAHAIHLAQSPPKDPVFVSLPIDDQLGELARRGPDQ
jgi:benzoylformate decarboxylase